ncbi:hypothetical protein X975_01989, partial [Stegodyphus mimosarum]
MCILLRLNNIHFSGRHDLSRRRISIIEFDWFINMGNTTSSTAKI